MTQTNAEDQRLIESLTEPGPGLEDALDAIDLATDVEEPAPDPVEPSDEDDDGEQAS